jgi:DNA-binding NtrC family response regulator
MPARSSPSAQLAGQSILIVEDEYFLANDVADALHSIGAEIVGPINSIAEAAQAVSANTLAGAVLDVNVRGQWVYPVAKELDARGIPYVFMTGYGKDAIASEYQHIMRCEKPFDPQTVASLLAALVSARR